MLIYAGPEPRARLKFWSLKRRARKLASEVLHLVVANPFIVALSTGEPFVVHHADGKVISVEPYVEPTEHG